MAFNKTKFIQQARWWASSGNLGYDQSQRWNFYVGGEVDCSSLVLSLIKKAGGQIGAATYTGNMSSQLTRLGWVRVPNNGHPQPGDILLNDIHHTAIYLGGGLLAQASIDERGRASGGRTGNQGRETNIKRYYNYPWNCYLRFDEKKEKMTSAKDIWNYGLGTNGKPGYKNSPAWKHLSYTHMDGVYNRAQLDRLVGYFKQDKNGNSVAGDRVSDHNIDGKPIYQHVRDLEKQNKALTAKLDAQDKKLDTILRAITNSPE